MRHQQKKAKRGKQSHSSAVKNANTWPRRHTFGFSKRQQNWCEEKKMDKDMRHQQKKAKRGKQSHSSAVKNANTWPRRHTFGFSKRQQNWWGVSNRKCHVTETS